MKQRLLYILIIAAVFFAPVETMNIGNLRPVQVVAIYQDGPQLVIETDTQDRGVGVTPQLALQNLKDTANGIIYLDTAEYVLMAEEAQQSVEALRGTLRGSAKVCKMQGKVKLENAADILAVHSKLPKLKHWNMGMELPVLGVFEDREIFLKKVENNA